MSILRDILRTYSAPREVQRKRASGPVREDRALACLMASCGLIFVAQWPRLAREAWIDPAISLDARLAGALFAWIMIMPLAFYALALLLQMGLTLIGRRVNGYKVRMSVFWALLASVPLWLASGLIAGFAGAGVAVSIVSTLGLVALIVFSWAGVSSASRNEVAS